MNVKSPIEHIRRTARIAELKAWVKVFMDDPPEKTYKAHQVAAMLSFQAQQLEAEQ